MVSSPSSASVSWFHVAFLPITILLLPSQNGGINVVFGQPRIQQQLQKQTKHQLQEEQDFTCNALMDTCPFAQDGKCDSLLGNHPLQGCEYGDCRDCDLCHLWDFHCHGCLSTMGCFWCPTTGRCYNSPNYSFATTSPTSLSTLYSCTSSQDFIPNGSSTMCSLNENDFFSDPLYAAQSWVFDQINVVPVWKQGIFGAGVRVRINDSGVESSHAEFSGRYDINGSCTVYEPPIGITTNNNTSNSGIASGTGTGTGTGTGNTMLDANILYEYSHGTAVASILAAGGNNNICSVGVAPLVTISSCNILNRIDDTSKEALPLFIEKLDSFDISHNSWIDSFCPNAPIRNRNRNRHYRTRQLLRQEQNRKIQQEQQQDCPFKAHDDRIQFSFTPCDVCTFGNYDSSSSSNTTTSVSKFCQDAIIYHCYFFYDYDSQACLDFIPLLTGGICHANSIPRIHHYELTTGILKGRNGKGIIYVFASGNERNHGDDVNFSGYSNSRLTISVGAVTKDGYHARYSNPGAALFVSAPGGDYVYSTNHVGATLYGQCGDLSIGTSLAAPVVSGVVALMLEANPNLTWRDVQGIIATTSRMVWDDRWDTSRVTNGAGFNHSNMYGFGIINAEAAVNAAKSWTLYDPEHFLSNESGLVNLFIPDNNSTSPVFSNISISSSILANVSAQDFITESVVVLLDLHHFSRGDLEIILTSPHGTKSVLSPGGVPETTQLPDNVGWHLMTVRNWGESAFGDWNLSVRDVNKNSTSMEECADKPFTWSYTNDLVITCPYLEEKDICFNRSFTNNTTDGSIQQLLSMPQHNNNNGITAIEACCACGGGIHPSDVDNVLRQWRLIVYGRYVGLVGTFSPTNADWMGTLSPTNHPTTQVRD